MDDDAVVVLHVVMTFWMIMAAAEKKVNRHSWTTILKHCLS